MKNLKSRIISAALAVFMGGAVWGGTIPVSAEGEYQTIVIRPENFMPGEGSSAVIEGTQWAVSGANALNTSTNKYTINNNASSADNAAEATIPIYIKEDGSYRMFVLMRDLNDKSQVRLLSAGIDDQYEYFGAKLGLKGSGDLQKQVPENYMKYVAPLPPGVTLSTVGYYWDGASHDYTGIADDQLQEVDGEPSKYDHQLFALTKGIHTFRLKNEYPNYKNGRVAAVIITNDPQFNEQEDYSVPSYEGQPAAFKEAMDTLSDTEAPVFSDELFAGEVRENSVTINWNTDADDIVCMEVSGNGNSEIVEYDGTNSYTFTGLSEVTEYTLGIRIMDSLGQYDYKEISVVTSGTVNTEPPVQGATNIMLRPDNFTYNSTDKGWKKQKEDRILFGDRTVLGKESSDSETADARVYLEKGSYRVMAYVLDPIASPGSRPFSVKVDGESADYEFVKKGLTTQSNGAQTAFYDYWDTGFIFEAESTGLHDIEVSTAAANVKFYGILITSNVTADASTLTADTVAEYEDITPPEQPAWSISANSLNEAYVEVSGSGAAYIVTDSQGNEVKILDGGSGVIENISALKDYEYSVTAYDTHGNAAYGEKQSFFMSPVHASWNIVPVDGGVKLSYDLTGNSAKDTQAVIILAIYDENDSCIDYAEKEYTIPVGGAADGELTLNNSEFKKARAMLWDNTVDMHPLALSLEYDE